MKPCNLRSSKLQAAVLILLRDRSINLTLKRIAEDTGLPEAWLLSLRAKPHLNPAANRLEILWEYLSGKTLAL